MAGTSHTADGVTNHRNNRCVYIWFSADRMENPLEYIFQAFQFLTIDTIQSIQPAHSFFTCLSVSALFLSVCCRSLYALYAMHTCRIPYSTNCCCHNCLARLVRLVRIAFAIESIDREKESAEREAFRFSVFRTTCCAVSVSEIVPLRLHQRMLLKKNVCLNCFRFAENTLLLFDSGGLCGPSIWKKQHKRIGLVRLARVWVRRFRFPLSLSLQCQRQEATRQQVDWRVELRLISGYEWALRNAFSEWRGHMESNVNI